MPGHAHRRANFIANLFYFIVFLAAWKPLELKSCGERAQFLWVSVCILNLDLTVQMPWTLQRAVQRAATDNWPVAAARRWAALPTNQTVCRSL